MRWVVLVLAGCGRIGFDAASDAGSGVAVMCPVTYQETATGCYRGVLSTAEELPWTSAESLCEGEGGHLVSVETQAELAVLDGIADDDGIANYWIGTSDRATEGTFLTVTARTPYLVWALDEPDGGADNCITVNTLIGMKDSTCDVVNDFFCEIDGVAAVPTAF